METPYSRQFIDRLKEKIGSAKWNPDKGVWSVAIEDKEVAQKILREIYGEDGEHAVPMYTLRIRAIHDIREKILYRNIK